MSCGCAGPINLNQFGCCCRCGELPAVREEGPPGPAGPDGGTPAFQVGTVDSGPTPAVVITQVTPLLYTIDFTLPSAPTSTPNTWSDTQTFTVEAIFNGGLTSNDDVQINGDLDVTGTTTVQDLQVLGNIGINGALVVTDLSVTNNLGVGGDLTVTGNTAFTGDVSFNTPPDLGIVALTANENVQGYLVLDHNDVIKFVAGQGYTARSQAAATGVANVPQNSFDVPICDALVITVPVLVPNQPTPMVDVEATIMYEGGGSVDDLTISMWLGAIGVGSPIDFWDIAIPGNESKQITLRKCNAQLAVGANNFRLSGDNNSLSVDVTITKIVWRVRQ